MSDLDFISFLKTLKPEDWNKMATKKWNVKDVVAHMIGWEKTDVEAIKTIWETKSAAWWKNIENYNNFNTKEVKYYKNYTPEQLIIEWEMWQSKVQHEIDRIGYENLKSYPDLFDWLLEGMEDSKNNETNSHYMHHFQQIKKAIM
ncbi:MAG: hypothetical protein AAB861_04270 [Patescibacteria group bacterium]